MRNFARKIIMEQNHLDILQQTLKLKEGYRIEIDEFIEANKNVNIATLIQNKQCDFYIFGLFTPLCEHLMAYIIADSVIRHKAGNAYLNNCVNALLARFKSSKHYAKHPTVFTNVRGLVQKCLTAYNDQQSDNPEAHPTKTETLTSKQIKRLKRIEEAKQRNLRVTTIPSTYSNGFSSLYREQVQSRISPDDDYEFGMSDID